MAATLAAEALARDGGSPPAILALGALALRRGDVERAGGAFTQALAATSRLTEAERAEAHAGRGLVRLEDEAAANADFEAALALEPTRTLRSTAAAGSSYRPDVPPRPSARSTPACGPIPG